jgi:hypothetical protein
MAPNIKDLGGLPKSFFIAGDAGEALKNPVMKVEKRFDENATNGVGVVNRFMSFRYKCICY